MMVEVAKVHDIPPGEMLRVHAHGAWIVIVNLDGQYYALADTCTHEDASLFKGIFKDGCIRCPLHGSRFDVRTGKPLEEPAEEPLKIYPVRALNGMILIGQAPARYF